MYRCKEVGRSLLGVSTGFTSFVQVPEEDAETCAEPLKKVSKAS